MLEMRRQICGTSALRHFPAHGKIKYCESYAAFCRVLRLAISSRGPGRRPLTAETRVRIPVSLPNLFNHMRVDCEDREGELKAGVSVCVSLVRPCSILRVASVRSASLVHPCDGQARHLRNGRHEDQRTKDSGCVPSL